jgi:hypothetical protein
VLVFGDGVGAVGGGGGGWWWLVVGGCVGSCQWSEPFGSSEGSTSTLWRSEAMMTVLVPRRRVALRAGFSFTGAREWVGREGEQGEQQGEKERMRGGRRRLRKGGASRVETSKTRTA